MAESIHDWAVKLNMVRDEDSFSSAEKLMSNFTAATIKQNEKMRKSTEDRIKAEQMAVMRAEGEKLRRKHADPVALANEDATKAMERLDNLMSAKVIGADTYHKELEAIYSSYLKIEAVENDRINKAGLAFQAENIESEKSRLIELETLKRDILARSEAAEQQASERRLARIQAADLKQIEFERSSNVVLAQMRKHYEDQEIKARERKEELDSRLALKSQAAARMQRFESPEATYVRNLAKIRDDAAKAGSSTEVLARAKAELNAELQRQLALERQISPEQQEANRLLRLYGNQTHIITEDLRRLDVARANGLITLDAYNEATAEATRRQQAMRNGAGNLGYAVGELARGAEDFITVMSITGYNINSVGMAMRGASNNIGQAASLMGGPLLGAALSVTGILGGQLISSVWGASDAFDAQATSLRRLTEEYTRFNDAVSQQIDIQSNARQIQDKNFSVRDLDRSMREKENSIPNAKNERDKLIQEHAAFKNSLASTLIPTAEVKAVKDGIKQLKSELSVEERLLADQLEKQYEAINNRFAQQLENGDVRFEDVLKNYHKDMVSLENDLRTLTAKSRLENPTLDGSPDTFGPDITSTDNIKKLLDDKEKLDSMLTDYEGNLKKIEEADKKILAIETEINDLREARQTKINTFEVNELEPLYMKLQLAGAVEEWQQKEIESKQRLIELEKEYEDLGKEGLRIARERWEVENKIKDAEEAAARQRQVNEEMDNNELEFEKLKAMSEEALLMSQMTKEQKIQYEWAKKRAEIMESGIAGPADLENIFNNNAMARANELEQQWKDSAPKMSIDTVSKIQALGDANAQIMGAMGDTKDKAMIRELKAIKDAINNPRGGIKFVEVN